MLELESILSQGISDIPLTQIEIPIEDINREAEEESQEMLGKILQLDRVNNNPILKTRLTIEVENLRQLLKMRKTNEEVHDAIVKNISINNGDARLYRALTDVQKTVLSLTTKINEIVKLIGDLYKGYQMEFEFNFQPRSVEVDSNNQVSVYRGSKDFIKSMMTPE